MAKNPKMVICRNCNTPISKSAKICPSCGAKNKKPFYKRGWFILLVLIAVIVVIAAIGGGGSKGEKFEWTSLELSHLLPEPESNVGQIITDSSDGLYIYVYKTEREEYKDYTAQCQATGFTEESETETTSYSAYNEDGYKLSLQYYENDERLCIDLDAPMEMGTLLWPTSGLAESLPVPESNVGIIKRESSDSLLVYVGDTSKADYDSYVSACSESGFSMDYEKGDTYYHAINAEGYFLSVQYEGFQRMSIELAKPMEPTMEPTPDDAIESDAEPAPEETSEVPADEPESEPESAVELVDGMHPAFKDAMDSYEAFYDEYCEFLKEYSADPSSLTLIARYAKMASQAAEMDEKFDDWDEEEMNDTELAYYLEVNSRVLQKLAEVADVLE